MTEKLNDLLERCPSGMASRLTGVTTPTLHNWRRRGRIEAVQTATGRWLFDIRPILQKAEVA
jgi:predicted site-specific integrase-resolvase